MKIMCLKNYEKNILKKRNFVNFYHIILSQFNVNHN